MQETQDGSPEAQNGGYAADSDHPSEGGPDDREFFFCTLCLEEQDNQETTRGDVIDALAHIMGHWPRNDLHLRPSVSLV